MIFDYFNEFAQKILGIWRQYKPYQKGSIIAVTIAFLAILVFLIFSITTTTYVPLFPASRMQNIDMAEVKTYLDSAGIPYTIGSDSVILVPKSRENQTRMELAAYGLPKLQTNKGYELFDSTTWIKGEKELQILEMRALKGQLEQDISQFENIRSANVILDIAPPRPFGGTSYKTKASVIVNLKPGARLSAQEIRSITYHVAGAVRGLTPNMVAISDTSGKLYQSFEPDNSSDTIRNSEIAFEDHLKAKIDGMLATVVGYDNFYTTVQVSMNRNKINEERKIYSGTVEGVNLGNPVIVNFSENNLKQNQDNQFSSQSAEKNNSPQKETEESRLQQTKQLAVPIDHVQITSSPGKVDSISIGTLIDAGALKKIYAGNNALNSDPQSLENFRQEIQNQLLNILKGYEAKTHLAVNFVNFDRSIHQYPIAKNHPVSSQISSDHISTLLIAALIIIALFIIGLIWFVFNLRTFSKQINEHHEKFDTGSRSKENLVNSDTLKDKADNLEDKVAKIQQSNRSSEERLTFLDILNKADPLELANYFRNEAPKTTALIFYNLLPARSAAILAELPLEKQVDILLTFAQLDSEDHESIQSLKESTRHTLVIPPAELHDSESFIEFAGKILENLQPAQQNAILDKIKDTNPIVYDLIRNQIFRFEDLAFLDDSSIEALCKEIDFLDLRLALYDSSEDLKTKFFAHIPQDQLEFINHKLSMLDSITDFSIQFAQRKVVQALHHLENEGKVLFNRNNSMASPKPQD